ncbi:hypothetical protein EVAR_9312_1 [Eumeta japonica]|uniref:Uncharacterized protein n=1 Tax=Eumeta variegata TaxID=151549 RepID=A0A4C1TMN5_EUMVA|nr:hypothetical protein EVAR_9312_1 [Eumeta japonica]
MILVWFGKSGAKLQWKSAEGAESKAKTKIKIENETVKIWIKKYRIGIRIKNVTGIKIENIMGIKIESGKALGLTRVGCAHRAAFTVAWKHIVRWQSGSPVRFTAVTPAHVAGGEPRY